ncbi:metal ABC transporter solute-binding protein, Zn/Mn family [Nocardioides plantarum]|uniref:Metal ABC transporter solute-binding protein, Zn/Mn family n=1 Tax=Nocardioides plantarum TaxID=29299 RepID=A0ABV5KCV9_9ACTN|nr:zinc ABC transporter substrate-binding protein [Nocardioides plantarum]
MKKTLITAASLLALGSLAACGSDSDDGGATGGSGGDRLKVVASTNVWGDVAAQVGGDLVDVTSIIDDPSKDPHDFEADADTLLEVSQADVVVENGGGFDDFVETLLSSSKTKATVINAFDVSGKADGAPKGAEVNEHVWYDVPTVAKVATQLAADLGKADPDHADTYEANAAAYNKKLAGLEKAEADLEPSVQGKPVGVTEPLPVYLAEALGLVDKTPAAFAEAIEEGEDVPVAVLQETLGQIEDGDIDLLFYNDQTVSPVTEQVRAAADKAGIPIVPVTEILPKGTDYLTWMRGNIDAVSSALSAR